MENEQPQGTDGGPVKAQTKAEAEIPFLTKIGGEGWNLADDYGKVVIIERPEKDLVSRGYLGFNGQKKIILTSSLEKVEAEALDVLAYIKELRKEGKKPKT